jgi:hypothetical protein
MNNSSADHHNDPIVFRYTRAEALADGVLLDLTPLAREAGFKHPTAFTAGLWAAYGPPDQGITDAAGIAWDILWMLRCSLLGLPPARIERYPDREIAYFEVLLTPRGRTQPVLVQLKAICDGGDDGAPVVTVLLPHED